MHFSFYSIDLLAYIEYNVNYFYEGKNMSFKVNGIYYEQKNPDAILGGCIAIYENVWDNPEKTIAEIENEVEQRQFNWEKAPTIGAGENQNIRTNSYARVTYFAESGNKVMRQIHNKFHNILVEHTSSYSTQFNLQETLFFEPFSMLKYTKGTEYKSHYDGGSKTKRIMSAISYFNNDYEGGELEFVNFKVKLKPEPGMLIIFPANFAYAHIAHPIISGTKYAMVTWITDDHPITF